MQLNVIDVDTLFDQLPSVVRDPTIEHVDKDMPHTLSELRDLKSAWRELLLLLQQQKPSTELEAAKGKLACLMADADKGRNVLCGVACTIEKHASFLRIPDVFSGAWRKSVVTLCNARNTINIQNDAAIAFVVRGRDGRVVRSFSGMLVEVRRTRWLNGTPLIGRDAAEKWARVYDVLMHLMQKPGGSLLEMHALFAVLLYHMYNDTTNVKHYSLYMRPAQDAKHIELCNIDNALTKIRIHVADKRFKCPTVLLQSLRRLYACVCTLVSEADGNAKPWLVEGQLMCSLHDCLPPCDPAGDDDVAKEKRRRHRIRVVVPRVGWLLSIRSDGTVFSSDMAFNADVERRLLEFLTRLDEGGPDAVLAAWRWDESTIECPEDDAAMISANQGKRRRGSKASRRAEIENSLRQLLQDDGHSGVPEPPTLAMTLQKLAERVPDGLIDTVARLHKTDDDAAGAIARLINCDITASIDAVHDVWRMAIGNGEEDYVPAYSAERMRVAAHLCDHLGPTVVNTKHIVSWMAWRTATDWCP